MRSYVRHSSTKPNDILNVKAKGPPKRLNSATFEIKISWPKRMFGYCPRMEKML